MATRGDFELAIDSAIAAGAIGLTAPAAGAMPMSTIQSECRAAGGSFASEPYGYRCDYRDAYGTTWRDYYDRRGEYLFTCERVRGRNRNCE